jgi:hypothetical protein
MAFALTLAAATAAHAGDRQLGLWLGHDLKPFPLPDSGYDVYLLGEMHGVKETEDILQQYLERLHSGAGLRDVAIEEDAVYEEAAQEFVAGRADTLPEALCLRAGVLRVFRRFNEGRLPDDRVRVHLVDVDSPAAAIREHLLAVQRRIDGAAGTAIPEADEVGMRGLAAVDALRALPAAGARLDELRTIRFSILAHQQGFEVGTRRPKGSPYIEEREEAIARNLDDIVREERPVLALYGSDHVSKAPRKDGGPDRDRPFVPLALRLERAGRSVFSLVMFPLAGRTRWRGAEAELPYTVPESRLAKGDRLDRVLARERGATLVYVDPRRVPLRLAATDISAYSVDAFLLLAEATPMESACPAP